MTQSVDALIRRGLDAVERDNGVRILFAIKSGSRAWGFASPDSDYDVRFVYVQPLDWYLRVHEQRDVIELPITGDLDINGWELRKALQLMMKSNPVLFEWLDSPVVYRALAPWKDEFAQLAQTCFQPHAAWHHYRSIAKRNYREYLQGEQVRLKKYFYVLRPLLCCRWIEARQCPAPMRFQDLLDSQLDDAPVRTAIDALLALKRQTAEVGLAPRVDVLNQFIEEELARLETAAPLRPEGERISSAAADAFLQRCVLQLKEP